MGWGSEQAQAVFETLDRALDGDGIVIAVTAIDAGGPAFSGSAGLPQDARFEVGSITKTMTATLLASLIGDAVVTLDDEVGRWLDAGRYTIAGPCREVFLEPIRDPPTLDGALVEIQFPIRPAA